MRPERSAAVGVSILDFVSDPRRVLLAQCERSVGRPRLRASVAEDVEAALQGGVVDGVGDAEVGVAAAEDVAGDDQQVVADGLGDELGGRAPGGAREGVEGALGEGQLEVVG